MFKKGTLILDGGLASTLQMLENEVDGDPLWSARLLHTKPDAIYDVHLEFLQAGADIIITASYQASVDGFQKYLNISRDEAIKLIEKSVEIAKRARKHFTTVNVTERKILVAGSVGPYGACMADGSEYTGAYVDTLSEEALIEWHKPRLEALITAGVDVIAMETFPALSEALAILKLIKNYPNVKCWVSFSCKNEEYTNYGDEFGYAVKQCYSENPDQLVGVGVNCTNPLYITSLLTKVEEIVPNALLPRIVYPNSGETWTTEKRWKGDSDSFLDIVKAEHKTWIKLGVHVMGGCCRVTPSQIRVISELITS